MWQTLLTIGLALWGASVAVIIVLQRRSAAATLAWMLVLVLLPIVGLVIYRLIGPLRLERKRHRRAASKQLVAEAMAALEAIEHESLEHRQLARVGMTLGESPPLRASEVEVFVDGAAAYASILAAVAAARHHVHLEYYIWEPDTIGTQLRDALVARARAGVKVRMIVDGAGSSRLSRRFLAPLLAAGVEVAWFNLVRPHKLRLRRADFRTHRKIVVCDGAIGFTGGMNIADTQTSVVTPAYWRDTHMRLAGAAVWPLQRIFMEDWHFAAEKRCPVDATTFPPPVRDGAHLVQVLGSGPDSDAFAIHKVIFTAIAQANARVWLTTPYFVPDEALLTAIVAAALRQVDVRLIVPNRSDSRLVDLAARSYFPELIAAGVHVYEYQPRFIHAKTMVCDDAIAMVGTANLDNRSFRLNFEVAALVFGEAANRTLAEAFTADQEASRRLTRADLHRQKLPVRFGQAAARLFSPLL